MPSVSLVSLKWRERPRNRVRRASGDSIHAALKIYHSAAIGAAIVERIMNSEIREIGWKNKSE
jgi:hypothetical protein